MCNFEVRAVIKYLRLKGLSPHEVYDDLVQTLGGSAPSYFTVKKWHHEVCGRTSCEDEHRSEVHPLRALKKTSKL